MYASQKRENPIKKVPLFYPLFSFAIEDRYFGDSLWGTGSSVVALMLYFLAYFGGFSSLLFASRPYELAQAEVVDCLFQNDEGTDVVYRYVVKYSVGGRQITTEIHAYDDLEEAYLKGETLDIHYLVRKPRIAKQASINHPKGLILFFWFLLAGGFCYLAYLLFQSYRRFLFYRAVVDWEAVSATITYPKKYTFEQLHEKLCDDGGIISKSVKIKYKFTAKLGNVITKSISVQDSEELLKLKAHEDELIVLYHPRIPHFSVLWYPASNLSEGELFQNVNEAGKIKLPKFFDLIFILFRGLVVFPFFGIGFILMLYMFFMEEADVFYVLSMFF